MQETVVELIADKDALRLEIVKLKAELAEAKQNRHDENCDTRDAMIQGKPCNCYSILFADRDHWRRKFEEFSRLVIEYHNKYKSWVDTAEQLKAVINKLEQRQ